MPNGKHWVTFTIVMEVSLTFQKTNIECLPLAVEMVKTPYGDI